MPKSRMTWSRFENSEASNIIALFCVQRVVFRGSARERERYRGCAHLLRSRFAPVLVHQRGDLRAPLAEQLLDQLVAPEQLDRVERLLPELREQLLLQLHRERGLVGADDLDALERDCDDSAGRGHQHRVHVDVNNDGLDERAALSARSRAVSMSAPRPARTESRGEQSGRLGRTP